MSDANEIAFKLRKLADEVEELSPGERSELSPGQLLLRERSRQRMSQAELAKRSGVSINTIIRVENGHTVPRTSTIMALADVLGISWNLLEGSVDD